MRLVATCVFFMMMAVMASPPRALAQSDAKALEEYRNAQEYEDCMTLARRVPGDGFESALAWAAQGGGAPAQHCAAVAQIGLKDFRGAAVRLQEAAESLSAEQAGLAAELMGQAGQAWVMAGDLERAHVIQTGALKLAPDNVDLLVDRAVTRASAKNYWEAIDDLNLAAELAPDRTDVYVYRASAYRYVDAPDLAQEDVGRALALDPENADALLERGILRRLAGDLAGARKDWLDAVTLAAGTPVGDAAQSNLEKLDLKTE